ncbi:cytochrome b/b6 domain-containing protein [Variovorax gossypii]
MTAHRVRAMHTPAKSQPSRQAHEAESGHAALGFDQVLVWDAPVRVFHGLMIICFVGAWLTAKQEGWRTVHATLGYTMIGLVAFRIAWGFAGTRYARFTNFVRGPSAVLGCLRAMGHGSARRHIGHSPVGALFVLAMLLLTLVVGGSGWASEGGLVVSQWGTFHEVAASTMLALAGLHIVGAVFGSWRAGESLMRSVFTGTKLGFRSESIPSARNGVALLIVAAVVGFWWYQWQSGDAAAADAKPNASDIGGSRWPTTEQPPSSQAR